MSITDGMTPDEHDEFQQWVRHQRESNIKALSESAMVFSVFNEDAAKRDIEYMLQTGAAVILDKPILLLVAPGMQDAIPAKLRLIADEIVEVSLDDVDTASDALAAAVKKFESVFVRKGEDV